MSIIDNDEGAQCPECDTVSTYLVTRHDGPHCYECDAPMFEPNEPDPPQDPDPAFHNSNAWDINQEAP